MYLDENIIFDSRFKDEPYTDTNGNSSNLVSFLGFWENGANIGWSIPKKFVYNLHTESLNNDGTYEIYKTFIVYDDSSTNSQTITNIKGFTFKKVEWETVNDEKMEGMDHYIGNFYYDRMDYELSFYNYNQTVSSKSENIDVGVSLKDKFFEPEYPTNLERNAYEFEGLYTSPEGIAQTKVDWDT